MAASEEPSPPSTASSNSSSKSMSRPEARESRPRISEGERWGLQRTQHAEIVVGVLEVVLRHHPVSGREGVASQLLVLLEHVLGVAANLDVVRSVGVEGAIGVLLRLAAAAADIAAAPRCGCGRAAASCS